MRRILRRGGLDLIRWPSGHELAGLVKELLERMHVTHVVDVGAHRGEYGKFLRDLGYRGRIDSFEPVQESFEALERNTVGTWRATRCALGDRDEVVEINVGEHTALSSVLEADVGATAATGVGAWTTARRESVPMRRLDALDLELDGPSMLKSDCQGADHLVLKGAEELLPRFSIVQFEAPLRPLYRGTPLYHETIAWLEERGFAVTGIFPALRNPSLHLLEVDVVMVRAEPPV